MNQHIDYGSSWAFNNEFNNFNKNDSPIEKQLKFFYHKDQKKKYSSEKLYVKAFYLHHLLDYFRETRFDLCNLDLIFEEYKRKKVISEIITDKGNRINFKNEINAIFQVILKNKDELYSDLKS